MIRTISLRVSVSESHMVNNLDKFKEQGVLLRSIVYRHSPHLYRAQYAPLTIHVYLSSVVMSNDVMEAAK